MLIQVLKQQKLPYILRSAAFFIHSVLDFLKLKSIYCWN